MPLTVCRKSQEFSPKACNDQASFKSKIHLGLKSKIHLGLGRGGWWSWALLLLRQVQERPLVDASFPWRWVWCKEHNPKGELGFAEPSELCQKMGIPLFPIWVRVTVPVWVLQRAVQASVTLPSANLLQPVLVSTESLMTASSDPGMYSCTGHTQSNGSLKQKLTPATSVTSARSKARPDKKRGQMMQAQLFINQRLYYSP